MKWNIFLTIICILLSAVDAYWIYNLAAEHEYPLAIAIESGICFATSLVPLIALDYKAPRVGLNIRVASGLCFVAFQIIHIFFTIAKLELPYFITINGALLLLFIAFLYKFSRMDEV